MSIHELIGWSQQEFFQLPWRQGRSIYRTLVSEIMLQQTTVSTVKNHFERFLTVFPDLRSLAEASEEELLIAWKGLGYYRRAKNLKKIAETLIYEHKGVFPKDALELQKIPGIGPYTSSALLSIGMDRPALAVDANLERVIARLFGLKEPKGLRLQAVIIKMFQEGKLFSQRDFSFRALNEALMDLGRTYCQSRKLSCELCVMKLQCKALKTGSPLSFPVSKNENTRAKSHELHLLRVFVIKGNQLLVYVKGEKEWLSGQHEVPTFTLSSSDPGFKQYPSIKHRMKEFEGSYKTGITKYKILNSILLKKESELKKMGFNRKLKWVDISSEKANLTTATLKGLQKVT